MNIIEVTQIIRKIRLNCSMELLDLISKLDHLMKDFSNGMFVVGATLGSNESFDFRDDPELLKIHQDTLLAASAVAEKAFEENLLSKEDATKFADAFTVADYIRINPKPTTESKEKRMLDIKNPFFIDEYAKIKFEISEKGVSKIMAKAVEFVENANAKAPQCPNDAAAKAMRDVCGLGTSINVMQKIGGKKQTDDALVKHFEEAALSYAFSFKNLEIIGERIIMSTKDIDIVADAINKILEQTEQKLHSQFTHLREGIIAKKKIAP